MYCKNCGSEMDNQAVVCIKCGVSKETGNKYCFNCGTSTNPEANVCINCGVALQRPVISGEQKSKIAAGLLGIFLGGFGIHNFYLGFTKRGIIQVLSSTVGGILTCGIATVAMSIWGLVEGILILTGSINEDANGMSLKD
jgi:TM2 domain-containing membrane protein YozV/ribosomal protein L40E